VSLVLRDTIIDTGVTERITVRSVCCQGATLSTLNLNPQVEALAQSLVSFIVIGAKYLRIVSF